MRVPLEWLREHCDAGLPVAELAERLTMTGTKVEAVHHHGVRSLEHFVVGRVLEAVPHPDADRLRVCTVDVATGEPVGIVCGAPNVAAGQAVAVARPGAVMPDGTRLGRARPSRWPAREPSCPTARGSGGPGCAGSSPRG